ncbi:MAG: hypothetical protein QM626_08525 [Microbacterium sp.]|uniref:hypothetical protein n=1 Tax=Microbacterium sp. TaxID=51671 RepID=UPI0039E64410
MSDGFTISSGGAIAVDADALREVATALDRVSHRFVQAGSDLDRVRAGLACLAAVGLGTGVRAARLSADVEALAVDAQAMAQRLRTAAAAYDLVELLVARDAAIAGGVDAAAIDAQIARLRQRHPEASGPAATALAGRDRRDELVPARLFALATVSPLLLVPFAIAAGGGLAQLAGSGLGRGWASAATAATTSTAVRVRQVAPTAAATAPSTLVDALGRIPSEGSSRVRVERYDLPGGGRAFAVYVTGTKSLTDPAEAWNMTSNAHLFTGEDAASLDAVRAALAAAGAEPGDDLYAFGYSQGGMIVDALAADGTYDTQVLVTAGSPTSFDPGEGTFVVELRHRDDPVASLAGGGFAQPIGAEGGFVAERTVSTLPGLGDLTLEAHHAEAYLATASLVDGSGDPRAAALVARLAALQAAGAATVYQFAPDPVPTPSPSPQASPVPELLSVPDPRDEGAG